jgi:pyruvate kinase
MIDQAVVHALRHGLARNQDKVVVIAGLPFGHSGSTNLLHVATVKTGSGTDSSGVQADQRELQTA